MSENKRKFEDKMIYLQNGQAIVSRIIHGVPDSEDCLVLYKPAELLPTYEGGLALHDWAVGSTDDYIIMPMSHIVTIGEPNKNILGVYLTRIKVSPDTFVPSGTTIH